jgi:hypothetical protein
VPGEVFIDAACELRSAGDIRTVAHSPIDVLEATARSRLSGGGILFIGARTSDGRPSIPTLRELRQRSPSLIMVLAAPSKQSSAVPSPRWCKAGIDELITLDMAGCLQEVKRLIEVRRLAPPPAQELEQLRAEWPSSWVREAVLHAWRNSYRHLGVEEWASRFGRSARTLRDDVRDHGFPQPHHDCSIGRWLHLAQLCDMDVALRAEQSSRLAFSDSTEMRKKKWQFRRAVERETNLARFVAMFPRLDSLIGSE